MQKAQISLIVAIVTSVIMLQGATQLHAQPDLSPPATVFVTPGEMVTIPINLTSPNGAPINIDAYGLTVLFPSDLLAFVKCDETGTLTEGWFFNNCVLSSNGVINAGGFHSTPIRGPGVFINLVFQVVANAEGSGSLQLTNFIDDIDGATTTDGTITTFTFTRITTGDIVNDVVGESYGCSWADYDNDGDLDLFVANYKIGNNFLYQNNGNMIFAKITTGEIVNDDGKSTANSWGDYDNDGDLDLFVANDNQNSFFHQNNGGAFEKITTVAIVNNRGTSVGCSWGDYDNDGHLDLFVANITNANNFLYRNNGNRTFAKIMQGDIVTDVGDSWSGSWGDYDNDGDLDLFVANAVPSITNSLYRNNGDGTFKKMTASEVGPIVTEHSSFGGSWGDYDNDGDLDLFVARGSSGNSLYRNDGGRIFSKMPASQVGSIVTDVGHSISSSWGDYDNDGDLDLFVANARSLNNFLYQNDGGRFTKTDTLVVGSIVNDGGDSKGCSWGDADKDGDLDLFVTNWGENNFLYQNNGNANHWINILCVGTVSNTSAIGAKVRVETTIIKGKTVWQMREISGQTGAFSQNSLNAEFGLGDATVIDSIKIEWPSGIVQVLTNVAADTFLTITEIAAPTVATNPATNISTSSATFHGTVNPNGLNTTVKFQYGTTTSYGNEITATPSSVAGTSAVSVSATLTGLASSTLYHFRVVATNSAGTNNGGNQTFTTSSAPNQAPSAPTLSSPSANAFTNDTPILTFNVPQDANGDSLHFKVEIDDDGNFGTGTQIYESKSNTSGFSPTPPVTQGSGQATYTVQSALADGNWWWRVSAWDGQVYGSLSEERKFIVDVTKPLTSNHNPAKGATGVPTNANIVVHVQDATSGVKQSSIVMRVNGSTVSPSITGASSDYTLTYDPPTDFGFQQTVTVSIDAADSAGNVMTTDSYSFTTRSQANTAPSAPTLASPSADTVTNDNTPALTFNVPQDANGDQLHFKVEIDDDGSFGPGTQIYESEISTSGFNPTPPVPQGSGQVTYTVQSALVDGDWWWRVSARDGEGYGSLSEEYKFIVDVTKPFTSNHNPAKSATGVAINTDIAVHIRDATSGVKASSIVMKVNGSPVSPSITGTSLDYTLTYDPPTDFGFQQTVTVSIDAADSAGNAMATDSYSFTTASPGNTAPSTPTLSSPAAHAFINYNPPGLTFNVPQDANGDQLHFKVEIDDDGNFGVGTQTYESKDNTSGFSPIPPVPQDSGQVTFTVQSPLPEGDWWWRVSAWDGQVYGNPSAARRFIVDTSVPQITHSAVSSAPAGQSQTISATLTDNVGIQSAKLFYRCGGASIYDSTAMTKTSGDTYQGTIPAGFITERGAEYYFSVADSAGNRATFPAPNPQSKPQVIQVTHSNLAFANPTPVKAYRMISVPFDLNDKSPASILEDDLGRYDDTQWRLLRYVNGVNLEFGSSGFASFEPGTGFWLITREAKTLDAGAGKSVTTAQNYIITLPVGWSQIGNPFYFTVNWSEVIKNGNIENRLVGYQGTLNEATGYDYTRTQLVPFEGYFVNNLGPNPATIEIPPKAAAGGLAAKQIADWKSALQSNEWALQITAAANRYLDKDNYIGCLNDASDQWDSNDFSEAPFFDQHVALYFPHPEWEKFPGLYTGDFRSVTSDGRYWDFRVQTNISRSTVTLALAEMQNLPADWEIVLLDKVSRALVNFREKERYTFISDGGETVRDFRIVVGKNDFIETNDLDLAGVPQDFVLGQNYPNPFNPETKINYELPSISQVRIAVLNLNGQLIRTLFDGQQSAGRYVVSWDGTNAIGQRVASGVYLVRMEAGNFVAVRKMVLAK